MSLGCLRDRAPPPKKTMFEDAVGDGTYFTNPNFEWGEEVEEAMHGGC